MNLAAWRRVHLCSSLLSHHQSEVRPLTQSCHRLVPPSPFTWCRRDLTAVVRQRGPILKSPPPLVANEAPTPRGASSLRLTRLPTAAAEDTVDTSPSSPTSIPTATMTNEQQRHHLHRERHRKKKSETTKKKHKMLDALLAKCSKIGEYGVHQNATTAPRKTVSEFEGSPGWMRHRLWSGAEDEPVRKFIFDSRTKNNWVDKKLSFCTLCQEPVGNLLTHTGYWDHVCMHLFFRLSVQYPRTHPAELVLLGGGSKFPAVAAFLHDVQFLGMQRLATESVRLAELKAIIMVLAEAPHFATCHTIRGTMGLAMNNQGERYFRADVGRVCSMLLPPMSAMNVTRFQQKCWGRQNLERIFDLMEFNDVLANYNVDPKLEKNEKGDLMRHLFCELHNARYRSSSESGVPSSIIDPHQNDSNAAVGSSSSSTTEQLLPLHHATSPVTATLIDIACRRLAFELVFQKSMHYMTRVQEVVQRCGQPPAAALEAWNYY